jgi:hypothetical protein
MLLDWVKKNKKLALKITGVNFLLMALVLMFWAQPKEGMTVSEKAAANSARMEASVMGKSTKPASSAQDVRQAHEEYQKAQVQIFLVLMVLFGVGFLGYGFVKKEETV